MFASLIFGGQILQLPFSMSRPLQDCSNTITIIILKSNLQKSKHTEKCLFPSFCITMSRALFQNYSRQELSLKCSAWKGFIPIIQWKSSSPKQIMGLKKNGSRVILGPKKNFGTTNFLVQRNCGSKNFFWDLNKFLVQKKFL